MAAAESAPPALAASAHDRNRRVPRRQISRSDAFRGGSRARCKRLFGGRMRASARSVIAGRAVWAEDLRPCQ
ncbi:hypothetical protein JYU34_000622 [Plutella xylostella]|uniref:Uncharacterized protein n=1 Tax=Plutella xylostella TaxID=51655 RepID=A0ABQ7R851_PLUXY|nr:hypothetical protein JYU34_000622 [Plutella xylostella]